MAKLSRCTRSCLDATGMDCGCACVGLFCARCGETTAFPAGVATPDGLGEVRTCENDCGQQITTPLLVWTDDKNAEVTFES
ncbi:hypothetical protein [Nocardia sp. 852002-20019_SCH5090214]|nr:hypothetical protein [Nocardia sp. 852002-20019_SCH5090214]